MAEPAPGPDRDATLHWRVGHSSGPYSNWLRSRLVKHGDGIFDQPHFSQREQKRERGFRSLVLIDAIHVQTIPATAGVRGIKFQAEIVPAQKPIEGALSLFVPPLVGSCAVGFKTCGHHGLGLDGLLIE